jgi:D-methionine transport system substrate-binding protein
MKQRNFFTIGLLLFIMIFTGACGNSTTSSTIETSKKTQEKKEIIIGFNPGPYEEIFKLGIQPILKEKGYTIIYKNFTDGVANNTALAQGDIDANIFQHSIYLESINQQENFTLKPAVKVPTPPMGLYSNKYKELSEVKDGVEVAMPSDPVNMARGLKILNDLGWITLKSGVDPIKISDKDIVDNPKNVKITPMDSAMGPRALEDVDLVAIQGNFAISGGLKLTDALILEKMTGPHTNIVAVKKEDLDKQFVKDIVDAYHSDSFQKAVKSEEKYDGYTLPNYFN